MIAVVCSWQRNCSILWAILAGVLSWLYVLYFALTRRSASCMAVSRAQKLSYGYALADSSSRSAWNAGHMASSRKRRCAMFHEQPVDYRRNS